MMVRGVRTILACRTTPVTNARITIVTVKIVLTKMGTINLGTAPNVTETTVRIVSRGKSVGVALENSATGVVLKQKNAMERIARVSFVRSAKRLKHVSFVIEQGVETVP